MLGLCSCLTAAVDGEAGHHGQRGRRKQHRLQGGKGGCRDTRSAMLKAVG